MAEQTASSTTINDESKSLDNLLDDAFIDFNKPSIIKKESVPDSADTAPPPSDPLQTAFEAMCFNDEKFLNELDSLPNMSNFPFGFGETTHENETDNNLFNLFSQVVKHADLLQKMKDEDIEKALGNLADQPSAASASNTTTTTTNEPHIEQLNLLMSSLLSRDVLLPACQAVDESYEEWLTKNQNDLTDEELQRFKKQHQCVKDICQAYEITSGDGRQTQRVLQKFQELQTYGDPPKELLFFPGLPGFSGLGSSAENLLDDDFSETNKVGQNDSECCLM